MSINNPLSDIESAGLLRQDERPDLPSGKKFVLDKDIQILNN